MGRRLFGIPATAALVVAGLLGLLRPAEAGGAAPRLFVLQKAAGGIVEHDLQSLQALRLIRVPPETFARDHPVIVSRPGQVLISFHHPDGLAIPARHWLWDGRAGRFLDPRVPSPGDADGWGYPRGLLSADGGEPFWYQTLMPGTGQNVRPAFRLFRGDSGDRATATVLTRTFPECACTTGACSESCPVGEAWAPQGVVDDFVFVTYFVPGQLQPSYESTVLLVKQAAGWAARPWPEPVQLFLDAAQGGAMTVEASPDAGCCGWVNESSDTTLVRRAGRPLAIFDEFRRYRNERYDLSFFSANAAISRDGRRVAHTVACSQDPVGPSAPLRVASSVPEREALTPAEIAKLTELIARHPLVEIVALDPPSRPPVRIPGVSLIGWLSGDEVLVFRDRKLHVADARDGRLVRTLPITVEKAGRVFLR
ncbi:MAG: hypothetical protein ACE147_05085 [Candidatus Methylomirabilales bacterium]